MTVRHLVVFRWKDGTPAAQVARVDSALDELPGLIPELRSYAHGPDLALGDGRWDFGVVAEFDDADGWATYDQHPAHQRVLADVIRPLIADRAAVQIGPAH